MYQTKIGATLLDARVLLGGGAVIPRATLDPTITDATIGVWDWSTPWGAPGGYTPVDPVDPTPTRNMIEGGTGASVLNDNVGYAGGGLTFGGYNGTSTANAFSQIRLPIITPRAGLLAGLWFKATRLGIDGFNNRLMFIDGLIDIALTGSADRKCTQIEISAPGAAFGTAQAVVDVADLRAGMSDGRLHYLALLIERRPNGMYRIVLYLDGVPIFIGADRTLGTLPATAAVFFGAHSALYTIDGWMYRARLDDTTIGGITADEIVRREVQIVRPRLIAL